MIASERIIIFNKFFRASDIEYQQVSTLFDRFIKTLSKVSINVQMILDNFGGFDSCSSLLPGHSTRSICPNETGVLSVAIISDERLGLVSWEVILPNNLSKLNKHASSQHLLESKEFKRLHATECHLRISNCSFNYFSHFIVRVLLHWAQWAGILLSGWSITDPYPWRRSNHQRDDAIQAEFNL